MKTIEQAAQELFNKMVETDTDKEAVAIITTAMREACDPLQHQLRERTQWQCACGGTDCAGQVENERLLAALDVAEGALKRADAHMRGFTQHAAHLMDAPRAVSQALARIAEARK